jgi:hypothetical protein
MRLQRASSANTVTSNQAQATVNQVRPTGQLAPTQTTCSDFANGAAVDLTELNYNLKGSQINSVAPGRLVLLQQGDSGQRSFTLQVVQTNPNAFQALGVQQETNKPQIILYDANCNKSSFAGHDNHCGRPGDLRSRRCR